jgi:DNA primase
MRRSESHGKRTVKMRFPPTFLDDIRARVPISQVVGRRVSWDKRKSHPGRGDYWACCPFHGEKTPSFHAEDRKGRYFCFGCGASGDHFRFLVEAEGLSFADAVAQLAAEAGLPLPERDPEAERREQARATLHDVLERAARFFEAALQRPEGGKARAYLRERGLAPEIQQRFRIGYAPDSRNALKEHLASAGIVQEQMIEAGLLVAGQDIPVSYDRFRDRIIFPIADFRGRTIAFGGRALSPDAPAKYLNSPETPLFHKSHVLFNGQAARAAVKRGGQVIAVEGYIDVIACVAAGFEATVAPLGTALTEDQLRLLWQMADEPVLCFDGDEAGLKAAFRAVDTALPLLAPGKSLRFALLPGGQDPDDLIRLEGPEAFRKVIAAAKPLVDALWLRETYGVDLATPERRAGLERALRAAVATIGDGDVRRHYETAVRERVIAHFGFRPRTPRQDFGGRGFGATGRRSFGRGGNFGAEPSAPSASLLANPLVREHARGSADLAPYDAVLIGALLCHPEIAADRLETLAAETFANPEMGQLANALGAILADDSDIRADDLRARLEAAGHARTMTRVLERLQNSPDRVAGPGGDTERAAAIWDDAAHLRRRAGALSIERQAAARALARETSDIHLSRLRDIQEQDLRSLRHDQRDETEGTTIVHPFKRR